MEKVDVKSTLLMIWHVLGQGLANYARRGLGLIEIIMIHTACCWTKWIVCFWRKGMILLKSMMRIHRSSSCRTWRLLCDILKLFDSSPDSFRLLIEIVLHVFESKKAGVPKVRWESWHQIKRFWRLVATLRNSEIQSDINIDVLGCSLQERGLAHSLLPNRSGMFSYLTFTSRLS